MVSSADTETRPRSRTGVLLRGLDTFVDVATGLIFVFGAVAMFVMVVTRYGFSYSDPSVEIIVRYCMIWGTFVGIAAAVRFGVMRHDAAFFILPLSFRTQRGISRITRSLGITLSLAGLGLAQPPGYDRPAFLLRFTRDALQPFGIAADSLRCKPDGRGRTD